MADDNRPLKYMRYAIGEIVLVVIGILIALQINNWNEGRKLKKLEIQTLTELNTSLKNSLIILNSSIDGFELGSKKIQYALEQIEGEKPFSDSIASSLLYLYGYPTLTFDYSAYETLKNHGIDIISNKKLKNGIITIYESELDYLSEDLVKELHELAFQTISTFKDNIGLDNRNKNLRLIVNDYMKLQNDSKFFNTMLFTLTFYDMGLIRCTKTKENVIELINSLDKEILQLQ